MAERLADDRDRRHHHHRVAGGRNGPGLVHHPAADPRRRTRRRLGQGQAGVPAELERQKYGNPGNIYTFQTSASICGRAAISRRCGSPARRRAASCSTRSRPNGACRPQRTFDRAECGGARGLGPPHPLTARSPPSPQAPAELPTITEKDLKPAKDFRLIGKDVRRVEVPLKVTGAAKYGMDVQVPGMVYGAVLQCALSRAARRRRGRRRARQVPGVTDIVKLPEGVGVIATSRPGGAGREEPAQGDLGRRDRRASRQRAALDEFAAIGRDESRSRRALRASRRRQGRHGQRGENRAAANTARVIVYHAQMEPLNATAAVSPRRQIGSKSGPAPRRPTIDACNRSRRVLGIDRQKSRSTSISSAAASAAAASTRSFLTRCGFPRPSASRSSSSGRARTTSRSENSAP